MHLPRKMKYACKTGKGVCKIKSTVCLLRASFRNQINMAKGVVWLNVVGIRFEKGDQL